MNTETKEKKKRAPRRNYERELSELRLYCEANVKSFKFAQTRLTETGSAMLDGYIAAYEDILSRLNGAK